MIECFFGHVTEQVPGNNITLLEMARRITNDGFCYSSCLTHVMRNCSYQEIFPDHKSSKTKTKTSWYSSCNSYIDVVCDLADHDERRRKSLKASMREAIPA